MEGSKNIFEFRIVAKHNYSHSSEFSEKYENFLESLYVCSLCGSGLEHKHKTDFKTGVIEEEAHCTSCGVKGPKALHSIQ